MNKLILIGNGFDLAHGLPTSYSDFINDFWKNIDLYFKKDEYKEIIYINYEYWHTLIAFLEPTSNYDSFMDGLKRFSNACSYFFEKDTLYSKTDISNADTIFKFKNDFFKKINTTNSLQNWVDIENEYYKSLKEIAKSSSLPIQEKKKKVNKLNKEFEQVKELLEKYLAKIVNEYNFNIIPNNSGRDYYKFYEIL